MLAQLEPGQVVLDLGSGAGLDVLLSARRVGPGGHAYGLDMTDEMLQLANSNMKKAGVANATFLKGSIDSIPLPDSSIDVVISNCVINLAEDKGAVIGEAFRVLRPGGLFAVADMVELDPLEPALKKQLDSWAGCISGTIPIDEYRGALLSAGFADPDFQVHSTQSIPGAEGKVHTSVDTKSFSGPISKSVLVVSNDPDRPQMNLFVKALVKPFVDVAPQAYVRFSVVKGDPASQDVILISEEKGFKPVVAETAQPYVKAEISPAGDKDKIAGRPGEQYKLAIAVLPDAPEGLLNAPVRISTERTWGAPRT